MDYKRLREIIDKLQNRKVTEEEIQELDDFYLKFEESPGYIDKLDEEQKKTYREMFFGRILGRINQPEKFNSFSIGAFRYIRRKYILVAASVILCLSFAGYFLIHQHQTDELSQHVREIAPGKNSATLTLANGHKIKLSAAMNGELAVQAGVKITKTAKGQLVYTVNNSKAIEENQSNILSTGRSEQYQVILPDGSHVWLNAVSSLTYPTSFNSLKTREVRLVGEAYFEIAKDKIHPFIVKTNKQQVQVLGTHFNINSYNDEPNTKTTLLEGRVLVTETAHNNVKVLSPGQQAVLGNDHLEVGNANQEEAIAWKNGDFDFDGENIQSIMRKLSRWYNVEVVYNGDVKTKTFTGKISRFKNISQVLKMLSKTKAVHFKVEGRRVIVTA